MAVPAESPIIGRFPERIGIFDLRSGKGVRLPEAKDTGSRASWPHPRSPDGSGSSTSASARHGRTFTQDDACKRAFS